MFLFKEKAARAMVTVLVIIMGASLIGAPVLAPVEAEAASIAGWCNTATKVPARNGVLVLVPSIGVGGPRNCQMSYGSYSDGVRAMQAALYDCLSLLHQAPDGDWGPNTDAALLRFQRSYRLTTDGVYGPLTHNKMYFSNYYIPPVPTGYSCGYDYAV